MHEIYFYKDRSGNQPVLEYLEDLANETFTGQSFVCRMA